MNNKDVVKQAADTFEEIFGIRFEHHVIKWTNGQGNTYAAYAVMPEGQDISIHGTEYHSLFTITIDDYDIGEGYEYFATDAETFRKVVIDAIGDFTN